MEKALVPTIDGEGKPPVRLLVLDTEQQEATVIAQVWLVNPAVRDQ